MLEELRDARVEVLGVRGMRDPRNGGYWKVVRWVKERGEEEKGRWECEGQSLEVDLNLDEG